MLTGEKRFTRPPLCCGVLLWKRRRQGLNKITVPWRWARLTSAHFAQSKGPTPLGGGVRGGARKVISPPADPRQRNVLKEKGTDGRGRTRREAEKRLQRKTFSICTISCRRKSFGETFRCAAAMSNVKNRTRRSWTLVASLSSEGSPGLDLSAWWSAKAKRQPRPPCSPGPRWPTCHPQPAGVPPPARLLEDPAL